MIGVWLGLLPIAPIQATPPADTGKRVIEKAADLYKSGDLAGASEAARKAIELNPSSAEAHHLLGLVYFKEKKPAQAVEAFTHALKLKHSDRIVCCFFGDGAINRGPFLEGLNWAQVYRLPVLFVCEDNRIAATTPTSTMTAGAGAQARATAMGLITAKVDGNDVEAVDQAIQAAKTELDILKRFDMPGFRPGPEYLREMKRYGILPDSTKPGDRLNVYAIEPQRPFASVPLRLCAPAPLRHYTFFPIFDFLYN